ncbi:MAG TPA: hypothetical protein VHC01_12925 [Gaiellaceae bacterium]|jgi:hypothetical protein|nr:hypothetical protein [Gaiellaceae bacterium]
MNDSTVTEEELDELSPEERKIRDWRYDQLLELGLSQAHAELLADVGTDLGLIRRLVGAGCAPDLAARIAL